MINSLVKANILFKYQHSEDITFLSLQEGFRYSFCYCFTLFTETITLTVFTEITLIKKRTKI